MLALAELEKDTDPITGLPMSVVTDPANQFRFVTRLPVTNWAAATLAADQKKYYDALDTDDHKVPRDGHLWSVYLPDPS